MDKNTNPTKTNTDPTKTNTASNIGDGNKQYLDINNSTITDNSIQNVSELSITVINKILSGSLAQIIHK